MHKSVERYTYKDNTCKHILIYITIAVITTAIGFLLDRNAIRLVQGMMLPAMDYTFFTITTLGESYVFAFITAILTIALIIYRKPWSSFVMSIGTAFFVQLLLKLIILRPRPFEAGLTSAGITSNLSSFPSGHAMMFFVMIPTIGKKFPKMNIWLWILAILVGFSRIYLGVHYLSDVIAGAFLGYGIGWTFMRLEERYRWNI